MATTVFMEALSPTMEEGRLVKWHKREGDPVQSGETLAEVETDKAVMDLVARAGGVLRQVTVREGETVPVGKEIAVIAAAGEAVATAQGRGTGDEGRVVTAQAARVAAPVAVVDATRVKASPLARRIAKETGLDLKQVTGSGPGGGHVLRRSPLLYRGRSGGDRLPRFAYRAAPRRAACAGGRRAPRRTW